MKNNRRDFLKVAGAAGIGVMGSGIMLSSLSSCNTPETEGSAPAVADETFDAAKQSIIGLYGPWANSLMGDKIPSHSFRNSKWQDLNTWHNAAKERINDRLGIPDIGGTPEVTVKKQYEYDGLHI